MGFEQIRTDLGEFNTIILQPVLRQGGEVETKKEMRMCVITSYSIHYTKLYEILFNDTVRSNIAYGMSDASKEEIA